MRAQENDHATHKLRMSRQAELLAISRSNLYYLPHSTSEADLALIRRIDELHLNYPFAGGRMLRNLLRLEGVQVGRQHVATLMAKMDIAAISRQRKTSAPHPAHPIYHYLLRGLTIDRPISSLGSRHYLHFHAPGLRLSGRHCRLGNPQGTLPSGVDQQEVACI